MGQGTGGQPEGLSHQAGQLQQISEGGRVLALREQVDALLGKIGQLSRRCPSKIVLIPHRARVVKTLRPGQATIGPRPD